MTDILPPPFDSSEAPIPEYSAIDLDNGLIDSLDQDDEVLPTYVSLAARPQEDRPRLRVVEHAYHMKSGNDRTWFTAKIRSRAASPNGVPSYLGGDSVTGNILLDLAKEEKITGIVVTIRGFITKPWAVKEIFLTMEQTVWDVSLGDPRAPGPNQEKYKSKLSGKYEWPFSLTFPATTNATPPMLKSLGAKEQQPLPSTTAEVGCYSTLGYEIEFLVKRGGLSANSDQTNQIIYTVRTRPPEFFMLRELAYREGSPLLPPAVDPEGWHILPPVELKGKLFNALDVTVKLTLALSKPLNYARGSIIPSILTIESSEVAAVDVLGDPKAPILDLYRIANTRPNIPDGKAEAGKRLYDATNSSKIPTSTTCWWPQGGTVPSATDPDIKMRTLNGEIKIPVNAKPTFRFSHYFVEWFLRMPPPEAVGFVPEKTDNLLEVDVVVSSVYAPGPRPRAYIPAEYENGPQLKRCDYPKDGQNLRYRFN